MGTVLGTPHVLEAPEITLAVVKKMVGAAGLEAATSTVGRSARKRKKRRK